MIFSNGIISNGSILLYTGPSSPPPPTPPVPVPSPGDQPADQRAQGYPPLRGFLVTGDSVEPWMSVHVDELTQDRGLHVGEFTEDDRRRLR